MLHCVGSATFPVISVRAVCVTSLPLVEPGCRRQETSPAAVWTDYALDHDVASSEFWDRKKGAEGRVGLTKNDATCHSEWSPCSRYFLCGTTFPRLRVDNLCVHTCIDEVVSVVHDKRTLVSGSALSKQVQHLEHGRQLAL